MDTPSLQAQLHYALREMFDGIVVELVPVGPYHDSEAQRWELFIKEKMCEKMGKAIYSFRESAVKEAFRRRGPWTTACDRVMQEMFPTPPPEAL